MIPILQTWLQRQSHVNSFLNNIYLDNKGLKQAMFSLNYYCHPFLYDLSLPLSFSKTKIELTKEVRIAMFHWAL